MRQVSVHAGRLSRVSLRLAPVIEVFAGIMRVWESIGFAKESLSSRMSGWLAFVQVVRWLRFRGSIRPFRPKDPLQRVAADQLRHGHACLKAVHHRPSRAHRARRFCLPMVRWSERDAPCLRRAIGHFGPCGDGFIRINLATQRAYLQQALNQLTDALARRGSSANA